MRDDKPGSDLSLQVVREMKWALEKDIEDALNHFQEKTGCPVDEVYWSKKDTGIGKPDTISYLKMRLRIEEGL